MKVIQRLLATIVLFGCLNPTSVLALSQIIRPYQSVRSAGMGGVRITTGQYDENFFGNPARVSANPSWRVQLLDPMFETTASSIAAISDVVGSDNVYQSVSSNAGTNIHGRIQFAFPALYIPRLGSMSYALGLIMSTQFDVDLRRSYQIDSTAISDIGPAFTIARTFLDDKLSVGATAHATYRVASKEGYSIIDFLQGVSLSPLQSGGDGAHLDFDIGSTYVLPWAKPLEFDLIAGVSMNNLLGGNYKNLGLSFLNQASNPPSQPRTLNFGISAQRAEFLMLSDLMLALEFTDIGNNPDGSLFKLIHFGGEFRFGILRPRFGLNQGYLCAGLGLDLKVLQLDVATYGEELGLNTGTLQDRRIALRFALGI